MAINPFLGIIATPRWPALFRQATITPKGRGNFGKWQPKGSWDLSAFRRSLSPARTRRSSAIGVRAPYSRTSRAVLRTPWRWHFSQTTSSQVVLSATSPTVERYRSLAHRWRARLRCATHGCRVQEAGALCGAQVMAGLSNRSGQRRGAVRLPPITSPQKTDRTSSPPCHGGGSCRCRCRRTCKPNVNARSCGIPGAGTLPSNRC
jgi:hypothetical protein